LLEPIGGMLCAVILLFIMGSSIFLCSNVRFCIESDRNYFTNSMEASSRESASRSASH
jgi:hypothetical protein